MPFGKCKCKGHVFPLTPKQQLGYDLARWQGLVIFTATFVFMVYRLKDVGPRDVHETVRANFFLTTDAPGYAFMYDDYTILHG